MEKALTAIVGVLPLAYVSAFIYLVILVGRFLDKNLRAQTKKELVDYLKNGELRDTSRSLVHTASESINAVFGESHFSWKCVLRSMGLTLIYNLFFIGLSGVLSFALTFLNNETFNTVIGLYWSFPLKMGVGVFVTWVMWSFVIDYFALLKTRWLIQVLRRSNKGWMIPLICFADLALGFAIYIFGICALTILSLATDSRFQPPVISLELGGVMALLAIIYGKITRPDLEAMLAAKNQLTSQMAAFLHTNAPLMLLVVIFLIQLVPLITIGSDMFYASMMPSIWLWLFMGAVFLAKILSGLSTYLSFMFSYFKTDKKPFEVTAKLLTPVIVVLIFGLFLWPYMLGLLGIMFLAFLKLIEALLQHVQTLLGPP